MQKQSGQRVDREELVRKILAEIEQHKKEFERKGMQYVVLDEEQLRKKLSRSRSPMIVSQGWSGSAPQGGMLTYSVQIRNPDPGPWVWVFGHVFVGAANMIVSPGEALATVDGRFPRLTQPAFPGLTIAPNETAKLDFSIPIPTGMQPSNYQGNVFLYQADWHDVGEYLDRGTFVFGVT
jgi:hypothetical protein